MKYNFLPKISEGRGGELETSVEYSVDVNKDNSRRGRGGLKAGLVGALALPFLVGGCMTARGNYYAEQLGAAATQQFISNSIDQSMGVNRGTEVNVNQYYGSEESSNEIFCERALTVYNALIDRKAITEEQYYHAIDQLRNKYNCFR